MAGIGNATRHGILVSRGDALERLAKVRRVAFDKTGTLTFGQPSVTKAASCVPDVDDGELLELAASAELRSEHPLGKAIVAHYRQARGRSPAEPEAFSLMPGRGVGATVRGREIFAGNEALVADRGFEIPERLARTADAAKADGSTVIYVTDASRLVGLIALSDTLRPDAAQTIRRIDGTGTRTVLLTGDAPQAAGHIADVAGIDEVRANCLPEDKLAAIAGYEAQGDPVCMVGDGINDAPALKTARVGVAMGGVGSDITIEAADIVLMDDDIHEIPHLLLLSRKVMRTIHINLAAAMTLNFAAIALAIAGILDPVTGALVHNVGSVAVIINSSVILGWKE
jgi:heavy metal translocating P-type ATPase